MNGLCECGCGSRTALAARDDRRRGWVEGQPVRFVSGHNNRMYPTGIEEDAETHCWLWQGSRDRDDYGRLGRLLAHRIVYEELAGSIPEGLELDHLCRVHACVNPGHLEAVTHRENMLRGENVASWNASKTHCPAGHPYDEANTYVSNGNRFCRACSREAQRRYQQRLKGVQDL